jgi:hypothetical protein
MGGVNGDDGLLGYLQPVADQADAVDVLAPIALHADGSFALRADVVGKRDFGKRDIGPPCAGVVRRVGAKDARPLGPRLGVDRTDYSQIANRPRCERPDLSQRARRATIAALLLIVQRLVASLKLKTTTTRFSGSDASARRARAEG